MDHGYDEYDRPHHPRCPEGKVGTPEECQCAELEEHDRLDHEDALVDAWKDREV